MRHFQEFDVYKQLCKYNLIYLDQLDTCRIYMTNCFVLVQVIPDIHFAEFPISPTGRFIENGIQFADLQVGHYIERGLEESQVVGLSPSYLLRSTFNKSAILFAVVFDAGKLSGTW